MKYDVVIIGAGSAGVGVANILKDIGIDNLLILDKGEISSTIRRSRQSDRRTPGI